MGLFQKFKEKIIGKKEVSLEIQEKEKPLEKLTEEEKDTVIYDKGLEKTFSNGRSLSYAIYTYH